MRMSGYAAAASRAGASVLDRLLDDRPDQAQERLPAPAESVTRLRAAVHRDVEALLNARRPWQSVPAAWPALRRSPLGFGIPDFTAGSFNDARERESLRNEIAETIRRFEPRLTQVEVRLVQEPSPLHATLELRVDALLLMQPQAEVISFDTLVDTTTADVTLRPRQGS